MEIIVVFIVDLIFLIEDIKCVDHDNLIVTSEYVTKQQVDPNAYVVHLERDVIDMKEMKKKPYHESMMFEYFSQFIYMHKKNYPKSSIFNYHYQVFRDNVKYINKLNEKFKGVAVFSINKFTDLTHENFTKWHTGFNLAATKTVKGHSNDAIYVTKKVYDNAKNISKIDRTLDPVHAYVEKDQGNCSNAYVFAAVRMMELGYRHQVQDYLSRLVLSEQHAFDCTPEGGCDGNAASGHVYVALKNTGIMLWDDYPYNEMNPKKGSCKYDSSKFSVKYKDIRSTTLFNMVTEEELIGIVWHRAAFSTSMYVPRSMQHYKAGLLIPTDCKDQESNHMVVIAGYGTTSNGIKYWTAYNSWGMTWGEYGRFHIVRGVYACRITKEYLAYALLYHDEFPPFESRDKWFQDTTNIKNNTGETISIYNFQYNTQTPSAGSTTVTYQPWWVTTPRFTLNSSMLTSDTTPVPDDDEDTLPTPLYLRPRAQTDLKSNKYISMAFDKWYQIQAQTRTLKSKPTREILDSEYLRTSSVLTTPASWEGASKVDYDAIDPDKESESFYVP